MSSDSTPVQENSLKSSLTEKSQKVSQFIRALLFSIGFVALFAIVNFIAQPYWPSNYDAPNGFYEEDPNTIETVFLGPSHVKAGISPMELYEQYGICSYDLATDGQPVLASYFWLEETYSYHAETLTTVVFDVSCLRTKPLKSSYQQALDSMEFSMNKWHAVKAYSEDFTDVMMNIVPLFSYHERWKELTKTDFAKFNYRPSMGRRGYISQTEVWVDEEDDYNAIHTPLRVLDESGEEMEFDGEAIRYFEMMVSFCQTHNLNLVLIKIPTGDWTTEAHNSVQEMADKFGLDFLDFNVDPYYSDVEFSMASDMRPPMEGEGENLHLNHYGAVKLSDYLGEYLTEECGNHDVRGEERYAFMEEELEKFQRETAEVVMEQFLDPCDFLSYALEKGEYTILISVKEDAASALTNEQREWFAEIGLSELAELSAGDSYLAVIEDGNVVNEQSGKNSGTTEEFEEPLTAEGALIDGTTYYIESGGINSGDVVSILIDEDEWSSDEPGLNIVLYDNRRREVTVTANFDTSCSPEREIPNTEQRLSASLEEGISPAGLSGKERELYLYNRKCDNEKTAALIRQEAGEDGFFTALSAYSEDDHFVIYLAAQNNTGQELSDEVREKCLETGLTELAERKETESYIAVIRGGEVLLEMRDLNGDPVETEIADGLLKSCAKEGTDGSFVLINGEKYTSEKGILLVVYDEETGLTVDALSFRPDQITSSIGEENEK